MRIIKKGLALFLCLIMLQGTVLFDHVFSLGLGLTTRADALSQAELIAEIAYAETKKGIPDNPNKYTDWFGVSTSWCAIFVSWCAYAAGVPQSIIAKTASARLNSFGTPYFRYSSGADVKKGDIVYCSNNVTSTHVGLVYDVDSSYIYTAEGNMSNTVKTCKYRRSDGYIYWSGSSQWQRINYIGRPNYEGDKSAPVIKNAVASDISFNGYTVTCSVSDNVDVTRVAFPSWAEVNGSATKLWKNGAISNGVASFRVNTSLHEYATGKYTTQIFAYDEAGNISKAELTVDVPEASYVRETFYGGHTYALYNSAKTYSQAKAYCEKLGGHLVTISNQKEHSAVVSLIKSDDVSYWCGATDYTNEGKWIWLNGESVTYKKWGAGQPDNRNGTEDYLALLGDDWRDANGSEKLGFICEFDDATLKAPTALTTTSRTTTSMFLRWSAVSGATGYRVYRYSAQAGKYIKYADVAGNFCSITGLKAGTSYKLFVKAFHVSDGKTYWSENSDFLTAASSPAAVTGLQTTAQAVNSVTLKWEAVSSASGYNVYRYDSESEKYTICKVLNNRTLSCTVSGLPASSTQKFFVRAFKTDDVGTFTGYASNYVTTSTLPGKVSGLSFVSATNSSVTFKWNKIDVAAAYRIYKYEKATKSYVPCATVSGETSFTLSSLARRESVTFRVAAIRYVGHVSYWGEKSASLTVRSK